jgi:hypothetical protein
MEFVAVPEIRVRWDDAVPTSIKQLLSSLDILLHGIPIKARPAFLRDKMATDPAYAMILASVLDIANHTGTLVYYKSFGHTLTTTVKIIPSRVLQFMLATMGAPARNGGGFVRPLVSDELWMNSAEEVKRLLLDTKYTEMLADFASSQIRYNVFYDAKDANVTSTCPLYPPKVHMCICLLERLRDETEVVGYVDWLNSKTVTAPTRPSGRLIRPDDEWYRDIPEWGKDPLEPEDITDAPITEQVEKKPRKLKAGAAPVGRPATTFVRAIGDAPLEDAPPRILTERTSAADKRRREQDEHDEWVLNTPAPPFISSRASMFTPKFASKGAVFTHSSDE